RGVGSCAVRGSTARGRPALGAPPARPRWAAEPGDSGSGRPLQRQRHVLVGRPCRLSDPAVPGDARTRSVLRAVRIPDYRHPARHEERSQLFPKFLRAPDSSHFPALLRLPDRFLLRAAPPSRPPVRRSAPPTCPAPVLLGLPAQRCQDLRLALCAGYGTLL